MTERVLGVLGGSGLYALEGMTELRERTVHTPFGDPSDRVIEGKLGGTTLLFLPRHGRGHRLSPTEVPYRANVYALKALGATHLLSVSAVGSLREEIAPGHLVLPDQFVDRTQRRVGTFYDRDVVVHASMADPVCPHLAAAVAEAARETGATVHTRGTYLCIEGPRFSTRAESGLWRQWGADVVGMTNVPEVFLAREAELPYATLALATDYDAWRPQDEVHVTDVLAVLQANIARARAVVANLAARLPDPTQSPAHGALRHAVITDKAHIPPEARIRYGLLLGRYLG